jgi:hypothetical protein
MSGKSFVGLLGLRSDREMDWELNVLAMLRAYTNSQLTQLNRSGNNNNKSNSSGGVMSATKTREIITCMVAALVDCSRGWLVGWLGSV